MVFHSEHERVLEWHVKNTQEAGVQYPFTFDLYPESHSPYCELQLVLGNNFF